MATKISFPPVRQDYVACKGGLNLVQPQIVNDPGYVSDSVNFEVSQYGGYRRVSGYERFDGQASPSAAFYYRGRCTFTGSVSVGNTVTGAVSGATAVVLAVEGDALIVSDATGQFDADEVLNVSGNPVATLIGSFVAFGATTAYLNALYNSLAANQARQSITEVPGSGPVRGVQWYEGKLYAFRNNALATACVMYRSTSSGWDVVPLGHQVAFSAGDDVVVGDTLTQGSVTATISAIVTESGAMTGTAAGRLILSGIAGGNFTAGAATTTSGTATLGGAQSAITLSPNGKFQFDNYAFTNTVKMYGCDGVNQEFEFDGTTFVPLNTGSSVKASFIVGHANHLVMLCGSSLIVSAIGDPYNYEVIKGAAEISVGLVGTGLLKQPGNDTTQSLVVYTRDSSHILYGSSASDFQLTTYQQGVGAFPYSSQNIGVAFSLDERGIVRIGASQNFGNFEHASISRLYTDFLTVRNLTASSVWRNGNQYRLYFSDGSGLYVTFNGNDSMGGMPIKFPHIVSCACSVDTADGELSFIGSTNGFVYQMDKGASFDGEEIEYSLTFPYWSAKSPLTLKTWKRGRLDSTFKGYATFRVMPELSYGSDQVINPSAQSIVNDGGIQSVWDNGDWDTGKWDSNSSINYPVDYELSGVGESMAMVIYGRSSFVAQFTIHGFLTNYILRRNLR